mgnify:FL=1
MTFTTRAPTMGCGTSKPLTHDDRSGSYKPGGGTIISAGPVFENYVATHPSHSGKVHPITFDYDSDDESQPWLPQEEKRTLRILAERRGEFASRAEVGAINKAYLDALREYAAGDYANNTVGVSVNRLSRWHPDCQHNPLAARVITTFDLDGDGKLDQHEWLAMCITLSHRGSHENKALCAFEAYDRDDDGVVGVTDLVDTLEETTRGSMSLVRRRRMAEGLVKRFDFNNDGGLEMGEFLDLLNAEDYVSRFTMEMYAFDGASLPRKQRRAYV